MYEVDVCPMPMQVDISNMETDLNLFQQLECTIFFRFSSTYLFMRVQFHSQETRLQGLDLQEDQRVGEI